MAPIPGLYRLPNEPNFRVVWGLFNLSTIPILFSLILSVLYVPWQLPISLDRFLWEKIITGGDKHLLDVSAYHGISVLKPREFVDEYLSQSK